MPNWNEILNEIKAAGSTHDVVRRRYLSVLQQLTRRNIIIYYSGWLQKAHGILEEFSRAKQEIQSNPATIPVWQPIIAKYSPTLIGECEKAIAWCNEMTRSWLISGMLSNTDDGHQGRNER